MELSLRLIINPIQVGKLPNENRSLVALRGVCPRERMGKVHCVVRYLLGNDWETRMSNSVLLEVPVWEVLLY